MSSKPSTPIVVSVADWEPSSIRYMQPKVNERGGKSINIISTQTNRSLHVSTPLLMTWGVGDFVDEKTGESDGKYSMSLNFPNADYANAGTTALLEKVKAFETQILNDAVKNSEAWFGEEQPLAVVKHSFYPVLKYSKDKVTKKIDPSKPPSLRAKVPNYNGRWGIEIYDTKSERIFPCDNENMTPMDFIPKMSNVACVLQCGGLWFGGKGWGLTWKLVQCVVKPKELVSVYGKCHIQLSMDDISKMDSVPANAEDEEESAPAAPISTEVEDSDAEDEAPSVAATPAPVKKVIKKAASPAVPEPVPESVDEGEAEAVAAPKKKILKKKVT
uniref:Uncharacterized protein n=1 Tax=viral metagenome TaxID=1070528 RepID=A0A6C0LBL2_9ZZZZ